MIRQFALLALAAAAPFAAAQEYKPAPETTRQAGVPEGKVTKYSWTSKIFPGTTRDYWVYVPAQYDGSKAMPVMIFQDGGGFVSDTGTWKAHVVLDNLIHTGHIPAMIGIFINPGVLQPSSAEAQGRYNRSFEYDGLGDRYARFLVDEILPEVGKQYKLSSDPNDRGLAGSSSGGIAAFTAAWERPDAFRRVISFVGSYTNLRGGHDYSPLVRKMEPKPLRVFLQDGSADQNIYSGNWWIANQDLASALRYANYDTTFIAGTEGHNAKHGSAILPYALRWLWRGYPEPIAKPKPGKGDRHFVQMILDPASDWELLSQGHKFTEGPAVDRDGNVYFTDIPNNRIHKIGADGKVSVFKEDSGATNGLMFGPDGRLYACENGRKRIVAYTTDGKMSVIAEDVNSNDLVVNAKGEIYFTDPPGKRVWFIDAKGNKRVVVDKGFEFPNGVVMSPDQSLVMVDDSRSKWVWSFQVQPDGSLANGQPFYRLETLDESSSTSADGMTIDSEGYLYVTSKLGVQVCDQPGRVVAVIAKPHAGSISNVVFGGKDLDWLYVTAGDRVYRRHVMRHGVWPWQVSKPPQPRL
ncbi:MAG: SMP-30/gluconolactonase/LRE family protein [Bryobacteraceae bacterium]